MNWNNPELVTLYKRLAGCIQEQLEQDLTADGRVADLPYFGRRVAAAIFDRSLYVDVAGSSGEWSVVFDADRKGEL